MILTIIESVTNPANIELYMFTSGPRQKPIRIEPSPINFLSIKTNAINIAILKVIITVPTCAPIILPIPCWKEVRQSDPKDDNIVREMPKARTSKAGNMKRLFFR